LLAAGGSGRHCTDVAYHWLLQRCLTLTAAAVAAAAAAAVSWASSSTPLHPATSDVTKLVEIHIQNSNSKFVECECE